MFIFFSVLSQQSDDPWIECREVSSGRTLFYHSSSMQIVFDAKPGSAAAAIVAAPTKHEIKRSEQPAQDETPTSARAKLLNFNKLGWDFYNERCEYFRAQAARVPHSEYQPTPEAIVCPRYFSTAPVPPNPSNSFSVVVRLPASLLKNEAMSSTKLFLRNTDSAQEAVEKALKKCQDNLDSTQFVFKVTGRGEYIYGPEPVMDYEYVRYCQRHQQEINLTLVQMTLEERQTVKFPSEWLQPVEYESKYKDAKVYGASEFAQNSLKPGSARPQEPFAFSSFDHIPLSDLKCPYRIRVCLQLVVLALSAFSPNSWIFVLCFRRLWKPSMFAHCLVGLQTWRALSSRPSCVLARTRSRVRSWLRVPRRSLMRRCIISG
jgi:hypothetical protein